VVKLSEPDRLADSRTVSSVDGPGGRLFLLHSRRLGEAADYKTVGEVSIEPNGWSVRWSWPT
jgi:hypothetical protein